MTFIDDNAHIWLLVLIVVVAGAVAGLSVVYQQNFKSINNKYDFKLQELNKTFNDLIGAKSKLNETLKELTVKSEREEDLTGKYATVKTQKDDLEIQKAELESVIDKKNQELAQKQQDINSLNDNIDELEDEKSSLCSFIAEKGFSHASC